MEISRELLFFFSALGAFNGFLMGFYFLFFSKPKHLSNYFLGALLIAMSIRIGKSVFFYFNPDLAFIYLQLGLSACVFIGPFLYFYAKSVNDSESNIRTTWKYHVLLLASLVLILGFLYPFETNIDLWRTYFIKGIYLIWLAYWIASLLPMKQVLKQFLSKKNKINSTEIWVLSIYLGNLVIWASYYFCGYGSYILGALSFSFMLYLLVLLLVFSKRRETLLFETQAKPEIVVVSNVQETAKLETPKAPKYADKKIEASEAEELTQQLKRLMEEEKQYKNSNLKLPDLAQKLNILPHRLSQFLNDNLGKSFSQFLNEYRIEEAKELLLTNEDFSIDGIGAECGFNSKSTFYSTFKKHTGTTPAKFKKNLTQNL